MRRPASAWIAGALLAVLILSFGAPPARAGGASPTPCTSDATPRPCYVTFTVNGGAPPAGVALSLQSSGGNTVFYVAHYGNFDLSGYVGQGDTIHAVMDLGTYVPHFFDTTGLATSYSVDTSDPSHTLVTLDGQPRPSSWAAACTTSSCTGNAFYDYGDMLIGAFTDLAGAPDPSLVSEIDGTWVSTNAQAIALPPTFDAATGAFSFHVAAPHYETDGTTVNQGFFRAFLPDSVVTAMKIADPSSVTAGSFQVSNSDGGTVTVTVSHQSDPAGVLIDAPLGSFHYSSPVFTIKKKTTTTVTPDHFAVTTTGGAPIGSQTAGHAFSVKVTAKNASGQTLTGFSGSVNLSSNATCSAGCATLLTGFSNGVATRTITLTKARTGATVTATLHGGTKHGTSNSFVVRAATASKLVFVQTSTASLASGVSRTLKVAVRDAYGNTVTAGSRTVKFAKVSGRGTVSGLGSVASSSGFASKTVKGGLPGSVTIRATATGLSSASVTFTVTS